MEALSTKERKDRVQHRRVGANGGGTLLIAIGKKEEKVRRRFCCFHLNQYRK